MATTQHRPHGAFAGPVFGTLEGKTEDTGPTANPITQHRPHGAFTGQRYGTLSGKGASAAATISAATADPTGGTTADIGCTTDTASGDLWALVRIGGSPAADTAIEAGGQSAAVSTTTPSIAYTGLTAATAYSVDIVQKVGGVYSNVITTTFTTDNTGSGGGDLFEVSEAAHAHTADGLVLTLGYTLAVQDATHGHAADSLGLSSSGASSLTVNHATHAHLADGLALGSASSLTVADATHAHAADGLDLDLAAALQIADALHGHTAEGLALTVDLWLAANDATHAHTADGLVPSVLTSDLTISDAAHVHRADAVTLVQAGPRVNSAPPSGHGPKLGRRGIVTASGRRGSFSTRTR